MTLCRHADIIAVRHDSVHVIFRTSVGLALGAAIADLVSDGSLERLRIDRH